MGFIDDDSVVPASNLIHLLIDHWELLQGSDDDTHTVVQSIPEVFGVLVLANGFDCAKGMVETGNGVL